MDKVHINIKKLRESTGLSQAAMADELNIGRTTYINFEQGKTKLYAKTLSKFARFIKRSEEEIIFGGTPLDDDDILKEERNHEEEKKAIIAEYERRIEALNYKLEAAKKVIKANEETIRTLSATNQFLLGQLGKND